MTTCPQCGYNLCTTHVHPTRYRYVEPAYTTYYAMSLTWDGKVYESVRDFTRAQGSSHGIYMGQHGYSLNEASRLLSWWNNENDMYSLTPFTDSQRDAFRKQQWGRKRA